MLLIMAAFYTAGTLDATVHLPVGLLLGSGGYLIVKGFFMMKNKDEAQA